MSFYRNKCEQFVNDCNIFLNIFQQARRVMNGYPRASFVPTKLVRGTNDHLYLLGPK